MKDEVHASGENARSNPFSPFLHANLHSYLRTEVWLFLLFSIADVVMTFKLLYHGGHYESNPIAHFFLAHWGPKGMVYFKFAMVGFVVCIVQVIAHKHIETARWLLIFAIIALTFVVGYSAKLYILAVV